jgi:hypothetical protein
LLLKKKIFRPPREYILNRYINVTHVLSNPSLVILGNKCTDTGYRVYNKMF